MAEGKLEVHGLSVPWQFEKPLKIDDIVVNASGNHISVAPGTFGWGDKHFALSGDVNFSAEKLLFTVDLSTESLDLDEVRKTLTKEKEGKRTQDVSDPRVEGHIRFKTKSLTYERFTWAPFQAEISFIPDRVRVDVTKANLCGISTPGTVIVTSQGLSLNFQPVSKNQDLTSTILCLLAERVRMTGDFDLMGSIQGQGESEKLAQLLRGNVELGAQKGRIYRLNLLSKIFSFVNVTGIVAGRLPDFRDKGLAYDSVKVKVDLQNGKIVVKEGTLQGPTVGIASSGEIDPKAQKIDFTVLVAPFRTVDYVISKIPLVNHILGGTLISIPVKVTGDLEDPRVRPLSPSAVESDLLGIMERTLGLPFRLIHLFLPKKEEEQGGP
jgi:hypothetical protein